MGLEQTVRFPGSTVPDWRTVRDLLAGHGLPVQLKMIDGELAFPEEVPAEPWRELRVAGAGGMVTLRREAERVILVTWGNADAALLQIRNALAWALAETGAGRIETPDGERTATEFLQTADLPAELGTD